MSASCCEKWGKDLRTATFRIYIGIGMNDPRKSPLPEAGYNKTYSNLTLKFCPECGLPFKKEKK